MVCSAGNEQEAGNYIVPTALRLPWPRQPPIGERSSAVHRQRHCHHTFGSRPLPGLTRLWQPQHSGCDEPRHTDRSRGYDWHSACATMGQLTASIAHEVISLSPTSPSGINWVSCCGQIVRGELGTTGSTGWHAAGCRPDSSSDQEGAVAKGSPENQCRDRNLLHRRCPALVRSRLLEDCPVASCSIAQVILNLVVNALEALSTTNQGSRELLIPAGDFSLPLHHHKRLGQR